MNRRVRPEALLPALFYPLNYGGVLRGEVVHRN